MSKTTKKRPTKAAGKWWRKQPTAGKHRNRRTYRAVGHVNPHAASGPSMLLQALLIRRDNALVSEFRMMVNQGRKA